MFHPHQMDILKEIILLSEPNTRNNNRKVKKKERQKKQRNNRKLKNSYFRMSIENKWFQNKDYQANTDYVLENLGYY